MPTAPGRPHSRASRPATPARALRHPCSLLLLLALCGCLPSQEQEIARYRAVLDAGLPGPVTPPAPDEPLTLRRALLLANQDNERLAFQGEDYVQALIEKDRAAWNFLPTLGLEPSYSIVDNADAPQADSGTGRPVGTSGGYKAVGNTLRRFEAPVVARGNLFRGFRDLTSFEAAVRRVEERRNLLLDAQASLLLDVSRAFYEVLRLERSVVVITKTLEAQNERLREAKGRLQAGAGTALDVAQGQAQVERTSVLLTQARGDVLNARTLLAFLIGQRGTLAVPLQDDYAVPDALAPLDELVARARDGREGLAATRAAVEAARFDVDRAVGEYYPSVTLNLTGFLTRENFDTASKWNALLSLNLPIFSAGQIEADVRLAWSLLRQRAIEHSHLERQVEQEVRASYQNWLTSTARIEGLQAAVRAAAEAYRQARAGLQVRVAIQLEVLRAQDELLQAELALASEQYNRKVIHLELLRVTGDLLSVQRATATPSTAPATRPTTQSTTTTPAPPPATPPAVRPAR